MFLFLLVVNAEIDVLKHNKEFIYNKTTTKRCDVDFCEELNYIDFLLKNQNIFTKFKNTNVVVKYIRCKRSKNQLLSPITKLGRKNFCKVLQMNKNCVSGYYSFILGLNKTNLNYDIVGIIYNMLFEYQQQNKIHNFMLDYYNNIFKIVFFTGFNDVIDNLPISNVNSRNTAFMNIVMTINYYPLKFNTF